MDDDLALSSTASSDAPKRKEKKKKKKHRKHREEKRKKKRKYDSSSSSSEDSSERKHRKKHKRKRKKKRKESGRPINDSLERNFQLAEALYQLLTNHPALAEDLPILLVRLGGGSTMDFRSMTDTSASQGLSRVLESLSPYGVVQTQEGAWKWQTPAGPSADERVLVRVVRTLLNDIGMTMDAVSMAETTGNVTNEGTADATVTTSVDDEVKGERVEQANVVDASRAEALVLDLLRTFGKAELAAELVGLCETILNGEAVSLEGLPDPKLKRGLEVLFEGIELERTEMEDDSDGEDDEASQERSFGYCLRAERGIHRALVESVQDVCRKHSSKLIRGPLPRPANYNASDDEDDDGPLLEGQVRTHNSSAISSGPADVDPTIAGSNGREEWMLTPGKHDFLGAIKSQPLKSRQFSGKTSAQGMGSSAAAVDPQMQQEIDALRQAHEESRGPSLLEEHRHHKQEEKKARTNNKTWKWDRDSDLDSGRRVDKEALNLMLGGAGRDLKSKFQSSY